MPITRWRLLIAPPLLAAAIALSISFDAIAADKLPQRLSDAEFWTLVADLSEPGGTFRSDNLLSNEARFQYVLPELIQATREGNRESVKFEVGR